MGAAAKIKASNQQWQQHSFDVGCSPYIHACMHIYVSTHAQTSTCLGTNTTRVLVISILIFSPSW